MWLHIAKGFDKPAEVEFDYLGNDDYDTAAICPVLIIMKNQGLISINMYNRASNLILKELKKRNKHVLLYEVGTLKGCKLRAAFCRRQALKGA